MNRADAALRGIRSRISWPALAFGVVLMSSDDACACSCVPPRDQLVLSSLISAPLNARVRVELSGKKTPSLRMQGGADVTTTSRSWTDGWLTYVELVPAQALQASTVYEVLTVDATQGPTVPGLLGTFMTGTATDTTAPTLDATGTADGKINLHPHRTMCQTGVPHIEVGPLKATDPGRPDAQFLYAVWVPDAAGKLDITRHPNALIRPDSQSSITIGKTSACSPHDVPFPTASNTLTVAIAAVDEAGNRSAPKKLTVVLQPTP